MRTMNPAGQKRLRRCLEMPRHLLNVLTALSLPLFVAVIVLWVRSHSRGDQLQRLGPTQKLQIISRSGKVGFEKWGGDFDRPGTFASEHRSPEHSDTEAVPRHSGTESASFGWSYDRPANDPLNASWNDAWWSRAGFGAYRGEASLFDPSSGRPLWTGRLLYLTAPWWAVAAAAGLPPCIRTARLVLRARRRRRRPGLCAACGYNLTGNVSGVCPECGHDCEVGRKQESGDAT